MGKNILLLFFSIIASLLLVEGILRIFDIGGEKYSIPQWYLIATDYGYDINPNFYPPKYAFVEGAYKYRVWSNSLGCFDIEHNLKNNKPKILFLGDSFTWGYTSYDKKFTTLFERFTKVESLKCGVAGYGVKQALEKAKKIISKINNLSLIVYSYYLNDLDDDFLYPAKTIIGGWLIEKCIYSNIVKGEKYCYKHSELLRQYKNYLKFCTQITPQRPNFQRIKCFLSRNMYIYNFLTKLLKQNLPKFILTQTQIRISHIKFDKTYPLAIFGLDQFPWVKKQLNNEILLLNKLNEISKNKLLVLIFPIKEQVYPYLLKSDKYVRTTFTYTRVYYKLCLSKAGTIDYKCLYKPQKVLREFLEKERIAYIDFLPIMRYYADKKKKNFLSDKDFYWSLDTHFNERGNLLVGLILAKVVIEYDLLKIPNKEAILNKINMEIKRNFGKIIPQEILNSAIYIPKDLRRINKNEKSFKKTSL